MAVLENISKAKMRQLVQKWTSTVDYSKPTINAALQAVEDWFESERSNISSVINTATSPETLTNIQQKRLVAAYLLYKTAQEQI